MTASPPRPHRSVSVLSVVPGNLPQTEHECSPGVELLGVTCLGVFVLGDHTPQGICPGDHTPQGVRDNVLRATCGPGFQFLGRALSLTWLVILMALRPVSSPPGGLEDFCGQKYYCQSHPVYEELIQNWALPNVALSICHCTFDLQFREFHPRVCLMDRRGSECRVARRGCGSCVRTWAVGRDVMAEQPVVSTTRSAPIPSRLSPSWENPAPEPDHRPGKQDLMARCCRDGPGSFFPW